MLGSLSISNISDSTSMLQSTVNSISKVKEKSNNWDFITNIDEIREQSDIIEIVNYYKYDINTNNMMCCVFHKDTAPSLKIYPETNSYHCFGCQTGGDIFDFVMKVESCDFKEAVKKVAEICNIKVEYKPLTIAEKRALEQKREIEGLLGRLQILYEHELWKGDNAKVREYLHQRGFSDEDIKRWGIGYCGFEMTGEIRKAAEGTNIDLLQDLHIIDSKGNAFFKNHVIFPIYYKKSLIGFQGRVFGENSQYKYLTALTPETPSLWNSDGAQKGKDVLVFEGIFDDMTAVIAGFENSVAILGANSLRSNEQKILNKADTIYFCLDNDQAGRSSALKYSEKFGIKAKVVNLVFPEGIKDINGCYQYFLEDGEAKEVALNEVREILKNGIDNAVDGFEVKYKEWLSIEDELEKARRLGEIIEFAYTFYKGDGAILDVLKNRFKSEAGIRKQTFDEKLKEVKNKEKQSDIQNIPQQENNWIVEDDILYKFVFSSRENDYVRVEVTRTVPKIERILKNEISDIEEIEISFINRQGQNKTVIVERSEIATKINIVKTLSNYGFDIIEKNALDVIDYLRDLENQISSEIDVENVTERFGWQNGYKTFIIGEDIIGEEIVKFRGAGEGERQKAKSYTTKGSLEEWKKVIDLVKNKKWIMFELYQSFLPPLLPILEATNYIFSNFGETSQGKTLTNRIACSVWASSNKNSDVGTAIINADSMTLDALEKTLMLHTHIPVFFDDVHRLKPHVKSAMAYMVENGRGKSRGTTGRGTQGTRRIRTIAYTTSEAPLTSFGASRNKGETARIIEMQGSPFRESNIELVSNIENIIDENYGHAGRLFISKLMENRDEFDKIKVKYNNIKSKLKDPSKPPIVNRFTPLFAGVFIAGELANKLLNLRLKNDKIYEDINDCIKEITGFFDIATYSENTLEKTVEFFHAYRSHFFIVAEQDKTRDDSIDSLNGQFEGINPTTRECYGVWNKEKGYIGVYRTILESHLKKIEVEAGRCYAEWGKEEYIELGQKNRVAVPVYNPMTGNSTSMVKFNLEKLKEVGLIM